MAKVKNGDKPEVRGELHSVHFAYWLNGKGDKCWKLHGKSQSKEWGYS